MHLLTNQVCARYNENVEVYLYQNASRLATQFAIRLLELTGLLQVVQIACYHPAIQQQYFSKVATRLLHTTCGIAGG